MKTNSNIAKARRATAQDTVSESQQTLIAKTKRGELQV
jgi:hypothetical protein